MVALVDVRRWEPGGVETAFTGFGLGVRPPPRSRRRLGGSGDLARAAQERLAERLRRVTAGVSALRPSTAQAADEVADLRRELADVGEPAAARAFTVGDDGTVTDTRQTVLPVEQVEAYQRQRTVERDEIVFGRDNVLRRAGEIDTALAELLVRAANEQVDDGVGATPAGVADVSERQSTLFRSVTGLDPLTEQDRRIADSDGGPRSTRTLLRGASVMVAAMAATAGVVPAAVALDRGMVYILPAVVVGNVIGGDSLVGLTISDVLVPLAVVLAHRWPWWVRWAAAGVLVFNVLFLALYALPGVFTTP